MKKHNSAKNYVMRAIVLCLIAIAIIYYYPLQRCMAQHRLNEYMQLQGVQPSDVESIVFVKDYTQDGYYIDVHISDDPNRYTYHYFLISRSHKDGILFDTMTCDVYDSSNCCLSKNAEGVKYPPLEWLN